MSKPSILLVEDESSLVRSFVHYLKKLGFETVLSASSGEEAIAKATEHHPEIILMDIMLGGGMDGIQASEIILKLYDVPIIYLTAYIDPTTLERALKTSPYGYLLKPVSPQELSAAIDMTLQKHGLHLKLKQSHLWFASALKSIGDAVLVTDINDCIFFMNGVAEKVIGKNFIELQGKHFSEAFSLINAKTKEDLTASIKAVIDSGKTFESDDECSLLRLDGTAIPIDDSIAAILDDEGMVFGAVWVFKDITEKRKAEHKYRRLNRIYAVISQINQMIVRTKDKKVLLNETCRIAVEYGEFTSAWIGLIDPADKNYYVAASAGILTEQLQDEKSAAHQFLRYRIPALAELDLKKHYIINSISEQQKKSAYYNFALEAKCNSMGMFPICDEDEFIGAIHLCAEEPDFFDESEIALFQEVANDVSFAIEIIRKEALRERAELELKTSESRMKAIIDSTPFGAHMYRLKPDGSLIFVGANKAADRILGVDNSQFIGMKIEEAFPPLEKTEIPERYKTTARGGGPFNHQQVVYDDHDKINGVFEIHAFQTYPYHMAVFFQDITERAKIEKALRLSEERHKFISDVISDFAYSCKSADKKNYALVWIAGSIESITGYTLDEILKQRCWGFIVHPDDRHIFASKVTGLQAGESAECELRLIAKDGRISWVRSTNRCFAIENEPGSAILYGGCHDISAKKQSESELKESESRFRAIFEQAAVGVALTETITGRLTKINQKYCDIIGYSKEEITDKTFMGITVPEDLQADLELMQKLKNGEIESFTLEKRYRHKNGPIVWVNLTVSAMGSVDGKPSHHIAVIEDITARKDAEETILQSELQFKQLFEDAPIGYHELDAKGIILRVNFTELDMLGYSFDEMINRPVWNFILPSEIEHAKRNFMARSKYSIHDTRSFERHYLKKDGSVIPMQVEDRLLYDERGNAVGVRSALIDISEKKQFEQQLIEQKNKAEEMNALKSSFLKNMSHELRTPLIGILGYSEVLAEQLPEGESLEKIKTINRSGTRLLHTLNSILDLSRIEANKMEIKKVRINIIDIISDSIELFDVKAKAKHLSLIPQFEEMNIELELDRLIFANILDNLLSNAIKYTNSGHISVRVQRRVVKERPHCAIEIADTGIGINEGDIDYIFDEFRQVSEGYGRKYEGTGLGLTLTKKFVQLLGGEISVKSEVNKGSVFTLIFPMIADQDQMTTDGKADDKMALPLALLIDDDEATCEIGKFILSPKLETDTAENGAEALSKLQLKQYSVILLDINLGRGMNGIEVLHELRKMEWYRTAPIIAMTAYAMVGDKERFIAEGFDYYLAKPFSREEMMKVVAKACECINK